MSLLQVEHLNVSYGDSQVLWDVDIAVEEGEIVALIGANGAGKTTLLKAVVGLVPARSGQVKLAGVDLNRTSAEDRLRAGIAMVPEGRRLFAGMTVLENLRLGAYTRKDAAGVRRDLAAIFDYFPELVGLKDRIAGNLSGGEQQMCAMGRALMSAPRLLLVDEMSLGLAPVIVERLAKVLTGINGRTGLAIILVEQDVELALEIGTRGYVLDTGVMKSNGPSSELLARVDIREAYLGVS